jgi:hypothetical protein
MVHRAIQHHGKAVLARKSYVTVGFQLGIRGPKARVVGVRCAQALLASGPLPPVLGRIACGVTVSIGKLGLKPVDLSCELGYALLEL